MWGSREGISQCLGRRCYNTLHKDRHLRPRWRTGGKFHERQPGQTAGKRAGRTPLVQSAHHPRLLNT